MSCKRYCLDTGRLNRRVTIQSRTLAAGGEPANTWSTVSSNVAAEVLAVGGGERVRGQQIEANVTTLITMRYRTGLDPTMRILYEGRKLHIVRAYDPDGQRIKTVVQCKEVA